MPVDLARVEAIFGEALTKADAAARAVYLEQACRGDVALRTRVEALLAAHDATANFLKLRDGDPGGASSSSVNQGPGSKIGRYKLLEQIGEGGFGVVFMAEQTEPVQRKVAIKIIKPGMESSQVIARFEAERQALALMDHPHIAKVLDAGTTDDGRPYFVMELVKGVPIIQYCDEHRLAPRQRLELFVTVCEAVQHAHQKGIIHRDLKPTNVLVAEYDERPSAMVIDFGVAKAIGRPLTDKTIFTEFGQVIGTIEYMSPEQAKLNQLDIDTRSDIYSLGVLLYELLAGSTPFERKRLHSAAFDEMLRIIREDEFPNPSTRLSDSDALPSIAANRSLEPRKLTGLVRGELDWIVMKALEKERSRRYETANGLARDIERYLHDDPVEARPPSAGYRVSKFARHNKAALLTVGLVAAALVVGTIASTWQAVRATRAETLAEKRLQAEQTARQEADKARAAEAEQRLAAEGQQKVAEAQRAEADRQRASAEGNFQQARKAVDESFTLVSESKLFDMPGLQPLRKDLLNAALRFYQRFAQERTGDPAVLADLAVTHLRVAEINFAASQIDDALTEFDQSLDAIDRLRREFPAGREHHRKLAGYWKGYRPTQTPNMPKDLQAASRLLSRLIETWQALAEENPEEFAFRSDLAAIYFRAGVLVGHVAGQQAAGVAYLEKCKRIQETLVREHPQVPEYRADLARTYEMLATFLSEVRRADEGRAACRKALVLREQLIAELPKNVQYRSDLALSLDQFGVLVATAPAEAEQSFRRAIEIHEGLASEFPDAHVYRCYLGHDLWHLANLAVIAGQLDEAEQFHRRALAIYEKLAAEVPSNSFYRLEHGYSCSQLGRLIKNTGRLRDAADFFRRAVAINEKLMADTGDSAYSALRNRVSRCCRELAGVLISLDDNDAVNVAERAATLEPRNTVCWNTLGVAQYRASKWEASITSLAKGEELAPERLLAFNGFFLAMAHWQLGHKDEARKWYDRSVEWMEKNQPKNDDLLHFRIEAEQLLGIKPPSPSPKDAPPEPES